MELIEPSLKFFESYKSALAELEASSVTGFWGLFGPPDDPHEYLERIGTYRHKAGLPESSVPASVFWLVEADDFIGHVSIRHELNAALERRGGHIGYAIRPSQQRQGYGSRILEMAIPLARELGIDRALLTCDKDNTASRRIIEKNGGTLSDEIEVNGKPSLRYWIAL